MRIAAISVLSLVVVVGCDIEHDVAEDQAAPLEPSSSITGTGGAMGAAADSGAVTGSTEPVTDGGGGSPLDSAGAQSTSSAPSSVTVGGGSLPLPSGTATTGALFLTSGTTTAGGSSLCLSALGPICNFEGYDDAVGLDSFAYLVPVRGGPVFGGVYEVDDDTGSQLFGMVEGNASLWAIAISNSRATEWGGAIGFWLSCVDASAFTGIELALKGSTPTGIVTVSLSFDGVTAVPGGTSVPISETWTTVQIPFASFEVGLGTQARAGINGLVVATTLEFLQQETGEWVAEPGAYSVAVDDLRFY